MDLNNKKALVILNASAGTGKAPANKQIIIDKLNDHGFETKVFQILSDSDLISDISLPSDYIPGLILCCGGDGTLNQTTNRFIKNDPEPVFAYLPFGNTDSFAGSLGIPEDLDQALDAALNGIPYSCDTGTVNGSYFNFVASFCAAPALNFATSQQMKKVFEYAKYVLRAIGELHMNIGNGFDMAIESGTGSFKGNYIFGAISNLSKIDGVNLFDESFSNNDGVMDLFLIKTPGSSSEAREVLNVLREGSLDHPLISTSRITEGSFTSPADIAWSLDGEFAGVYKESKLKVIRESLKIMTP